MPLTGPGRWYTVYKIVASYTVYTLPGDQDAVPDPSEQGGALVGLAQAP